MKCPYCGCENPEDATKCRKCFAELEPIKITKRRKDYGIRNFDSRNQSEVGG